ncbi:MAG: DUF423 domain-containing protein [Phycisphaerales bacterium]
MKRTALLIGASAGMLGVIAGAFGAHGLRHHVSPKMLGVWHTAAEYQMYHALTLLVISRLERGGTIAAATWFFTAGIVFFSGSLYAMVLTDSRGLGAITPIGGVCFITGWALLAWSSITNHKSQITN